MTIGSRRSRTTFPAIRCSCSTTPRASSASSTTWTRRSTTTSRRRALERGELALEPEHHFARPEQLLSGRRLLRSHSLFVGEEAPLELRFGDTQGLRQAILQHHGEEGALTPLVDQLTEWRDRGLASVIACHTTGQAERLKRLLLDRRLHVKLHPEPFADLLATTSTASGGPQLFDPAIHAHLFSGEVSRGFISAANALALLSDEAIFGEACQGQSP